MFGRYYHGFTHMYIHKSSSKNLCNITRLISDTFFFTDTCYTENDAYNIATHGVKCHSIGEEVSDEKESKKVIYEEVERED